MLLHKPELLLVVLVHELELLLVLLPHELQLQTALQTVVLLHELQLQLMLLLEQHLQIYWLLPDLQNSPNHLIRSLAHLSLYLPESH